MDTLINMKNNLIQNFYIIGLSPEDFFYINEKGEGEFLNIFQNGEDSDLKGKIISKFPPNNSNFNAINDEVIINHCFPNGFNIIKIDGDINMNYYTYFELDNLLLNYSLEEKNIHSKMYFTCLVIFESLIDYVIYKKEIISKMDKKIIIKDTNTDINKKYENLFIPKVICFASVLPYYHQLKELLNTIHKNLFEQNFNLEKLIEQIVLKIPIPLNNELRIYVSFDSYKINEHIIFPIYNINEENIKLCYTNSLTHLFYFFSSEEVLTMLKYILLEIPILFFCENTAVLCCVIESLLSLLSPFKYLYPWITILPKKLYGFISLEKKFIFGINENYNQNFFRKNELEIDKNIVIASIGEKDVKIDFINKENNEINGDILKIEEENTPILDKKILDNNNYIDNDFVIFNGTKVDLINIELPNDAKKILSDDIADICKKIQGNKKNFNAEEFNYKIRYSFYKFFTNILSGYTDYFLKSKYFSENYNSKSNGFELLYKNNPEKELTDLNFVKEIFNLEEFANKSDNPLFFFVFCQTKLFWDFLRERIYLDDKINSMKHRQFDQICFLKNHKEFRKKKENKGIYETFKKEEKYEEKLYKIIEIKINKDDFSDFEKEQINKKDKIELLTKYAQDLSFEKGNNYKKYYLFPKLIFDNEFFDTKYENLFFTHEIEIPTSKIIDNYKSLCMKNSADYYRQRRYIFPPASLEKLPITNNSKVNFSINSYYYIFFDWIILLCGSLWYCEPIERIVRLDEILVILDKLDYIEEIVIKLCFNSFIKYGNKMQCIQIYEKLKKFYGYSNYYYLNLLNNKLSSKENVEFEEYLIDKEYTFKDRSLILNFENFVKGMSKPPKKKGINMNISLRNSMYNIGMKLKMSVIQNIDYQKRLENDYKEKIIFSSEQYCKKCKCYNSFDFEEIKKQNLSEINYRYKCIKCKTYKDDVIIKYQVLLFNKKRNELYITKMGEFKLLTPNRIYKELILKLISKINWEINVENIMNEEKNNFMNYLFYFSTEELSFDFLLPFNKLTEENIDLIQNNLCSAICDINKKRFSILNKVEAIDINKSLVENLENENFIPIDISSSDNFDKYFDLTPCVIDKEKNIFYEDGNEIGNNDDKNTNYFAINRQE